MKAGSTSGAFHDIVKPNPSVTLVATAGVLAESGMAPGSGYNSEMVQERSQEKCCCSGYSYTQNSYIVHVHVYMICISPSGLGISTDRSDTPGMRSLISARE